MGKKLGGETMFENFYEELEYESYSLADETDYSDEEWGEVFDGFDD